ncbi:MAG: lipopolysaccharide kinase InaA family protein [Planctomycetota bacterium]|jgi:hypothetical protein
MTVVYQEIEPGFFADPAFLPQLKESSLATMDEVFAARGEDINPQFLPAHRARMRLTLAPDGPVVYLKRYDNPPKSEQIKNWIEHKHRATTDVYDWQPIAHMERNNIACPHTIAYGHEWNGLFEKRSFIIIQELAGADPLEEKLPDCLTIPATTPAAVKERKKFIHHLSDFVSQFHATGYRHRDLYLCHIFLDTDGKFHLIDLQRLIKPILFSERYRMKDLTQLFYSTPGDCINRTDRLRFFLRYLNKQKLSTCDRLLIKRIVAKAHRIAKRDKKRNRLVPFIEGYGDHFNGRQT